MPEVKHYTGGCHCKRVRYEVSMDLDRVVSCNCSICTARGLLISFVPEGQFKLMSGEGLTDYQFNKKHIHHLFCPVCGVESYATGKDKEGKQIYAINVRCLDDVDATSLKTRPFDGRSL
jgi:hypothetical protein